jgi:dTDP-4-amino-4,6-dideoxygalactose transaminase
LKVPFFRLKLTSLEEKETLKVLRSGWVTSGPAAKEFEEKIKEIASAPYAIAVSSCTAGLHLALMASGIGPGDEVVAAPFTMAATIEAILYCGAKPVMADIDPATLNIDPVFIEKKKTTKTKAIVAVDIAGWPCDYDAIKKIASKSDLIVIEDAAHSLGAIYRGRPIGSFADATVFSFYSTKNITTGEGGMVVCRKKKLADKIRHLSLHGMTSSGWKRYAGGGWKYDITDLGYKYNLSDLAAGLGLGQLKRFQRLFQERKRLADAYLTKIGKYNQYIIPPYCDNEARHAWHLFIIRIIPDRWKIGRDRIIEELEKMGVGCGVHFIPIYRFSYFKKKLGLKASDFPNCERAFKSVISLPFYPGLTRRELHYVCDSLERAIRKFGR